MIKLAQFFPIALLSLTACSNPQASIAPPATAKSDSQTEIAATSSRPQLEPIDVIVAIDRTGSKTANKIPDLTIEQAKTLAQGIPKRGGRLKFLEICTDSDRPLLGLNFAIPATPPVAPPPLPAAGAINNFDRVKQEEAYAKATASYQAAKAKFDRDVQAQQKQDFDRIDTVTKQLQPILEAPANCRATDILGGIARADLSLNERSANGTQQMKKIALFITDGEHNTTIIKQPPTFQSNPELIVVSGGKGTGIFEPLKPIKFESIDAAIVDILSK